MALDEAKSPNFLGVWKFLFTGLLSEPTLVTPCLDMAESRKNSGGLEGREVEVFLKTPLFRFRYVYEGEERELMENAVRLSGTIVLHRDAGILLKVNVISNMKNIEKELPFEEVFVPFDKIDFMVMS